VCLRDDGSVLGVTSTLCSDVHHVTTVYMALLSVLVICMCFIVIATTLGCVATCCIHRCQHVRGQQSGQGEATSFYPVSGRKASHIPNATSNMSVCMPTNSCMLEVPSPRRSWPNMCSSCCMFDIFVHSFPQSCLTPVSKICHIWLENQYFLSQNVNDSVQDVCNYNCWQTWY